jgi:xylulokinase
MSTHEVVLGVDIGTSSSKGVLVEPDGTVVAVARRHHCVSRPRPGWAEHDAESVWWADFLDLTRELVPKSGGGIASVCVSGIGPCVLAASADGRPLRPAILYGVDTRAAHQIDELTERYGADEILERCGSPLTSQAVGPKLAWLHAAEPEIGQAMKRWFMASSFIVYRLTGEYVLDHHSASQSDPLYDLERQQFNVAWASEVSPGLELPRLVEPADIVGRVSAAAAASTGLRAGIPVCGGTIDALAEASSVGVERPGDLMLMYGSTMFMIKVGHAGRPSPKLWTTTGARRQVRCVAAGMATGGILAEWFRTLSGGEDYEGLFRGAEQVPAGSHGLLMLPYFAGERTPLFDHRARGVICGLTVSHTREDLFRAILESVAFGVRHNVETIAEVGGSIDRIRIVGGGVQDELWPQIVSDVLGAPQERPRLTLGACYGDALFAARGAGLIASESTWNGIEAVVEPDAARAERYDELYTYYRALYPSTLDVSHALADSQLSAAEQREPPLDLVS